MSFKDYTTGQLLEWGKKGREKIMEESRKLRDLHYASAKEHKAVVEHLLNSINSLKEAARNAPDEKNMNFLMELAKAHHAKLLPLMEAHQRAYVAHIKAAKEHEHVCTLYNGNKEAKKDADEFSNIAHRMSKDASESK